MKKGTIEAYRSKLQEAGIIENNQSMTEEHLQVFEKIVNEKTDNDTWESLMNKHIFTDLRKYMQHEFKWTEKIIINYIIKAVNDGDYGVYELDIKNNKEDFRIFCSCIDNFVELGKTEYVYDGSLGTDGGPILYKVVTPNNTQYYIIGKYNKHTKEDDIHVFYNPLSYFEIMQCKYIMEIAYVQTHKVSNLLVKTIFFYSRKIYVFYPLTIVIKKTIAYNKYITNGLVVWLLLFVCY